MQLIFTWIKISQTPVFTKMTHIHVYKELPIIRILVHCLSMSTWYTLQHYQKQLRLVFIVYWKRVMKNQILNFFFKQTQFPVFCWHLPRASIIYFRAKRMLFIAWSCCILVFPFAFVYFPRLFLRWCYPKFRSLNKLISKIKSSNFCWFLFGKGDENS